MEVSGQHFLDIDEAPASFTHARTKFLRHHELSPSKRNSWPLRPLEWRDEFTENKGQCTNSNPAFRPATSDCWRTSPTRDQL